MENRPVVKIAGKRYIAKNLTAGAYRQVILLMEEAEKLSAEDFKEDALYVIKEAFGLTEELMEKINVADVFPLIGEINQWAMHAYMEKVAQLPNAKGPEATPGQG